MFRLWDFLGGVAGGGVVDIVGCRGDAEGSYRNLYIVKEKEKGRNLYIL